MKSRTLLCTMNPYAMGCVLAILLIVTDTQASEGTSEAPSFQVAPGSDLLVSGPGSHDGHSNSISIEIPEDAGIAQVFTYWTGQDENAGSITINGTATEGVRIGPNKTYGAKITRAHLVSSGMNVLSFGGLDFSNTTDCAVVGVILDDGSTSDIGILDASQGGNAPTAFQVAPSAKSQTGTAWLLLGRFGEIRPIAVETVSGGITNVDKNVLADITENFPNLIQLDVPIPAGATNANIRLVYPNSTKSMSEIPEEWLFTAWKLPLESMAGPRPNTLDYWKTNPDQWPKNELGLHSKKEALELLGERADGKPYTLLAQQYIGIELNMENGATIPDEILKAWWEAEDLLKTQGTEGAIPRDSEKSETAKHLASIMDDYNSGRLDPCNCD